MNTGWFGGLYRSSEWIMRLAFLNLLWIAFSIVGLILLGLFPATAAMFTVTRKWVMSDTEIPIFKTFWTAYKAEFKQANIVGYLILLFGFFLYFDLRFAQNQENFFQYFQFFFLGLLLFYYVMVLYLFPVLIHYKLKPLSYIKYAFILAIGRPIYSVFLLAGNVAIYYMIMLIPGLLPFYSGSVMSLLLMWIALMAFPKLIDSEE